MNSYESGLLSPSGGLSQYLQDGGGNQQQTSMGTPRPGTPRGSHFRLSPDGNLNPGTPGAASTHDHHGGKFPNSPWSGSEPATPGSGYSRAAVVPSSPYISSYPNTPATPGGGGFYQKPGGITSANGNGSNGNTTAVPPGSPWTDRSVCTPGPMTPLTPATPMHAMSDHSGSNGAFGSGNGSPTFSDNGSSISNNNNNNNGKHSSIHNAPSLAALLQEVPTENLLPVPVMNHSVQQNNVQQQQQLQPPNSVPVQNGNSGNPNVALPPLPHISENDINLNVENNPNLISEFEQFFEQFISNRKSQESNNNNTNSNQQQQQQQQQQSQPPPQPQPQQQHLPMQNMNAQQQSMLQQQQQQNHPTPQQQQQLMNPMGHMGMTNGNPGMMYNGNGMPHNGQPGMMISNGHGHMMNGGMPMGAGGPMRGNKFLGQNGHPHHGQHPYMANMGMGKPGGGNGLMHRARQLPSHLPPNHNNQYAPGPQGMPQHHPQQHHPHQQNMMGGMPPNRPGNQYGLHHQQPSASVYAPPPSGNNGGYVQIQQQPQPQQHNNAPPPNYPNMQPHHPHPSQNGGPVHWQNNAAQSQPSPHSQSNHGMVNGAGQNGMMQQNGRPILQQQHPPQQQQPPQQNPYFQSNPVNSNNDQGLSNGGGGSVLPPTTYPFDLGGSSGGPASNNPSLPMTPGTSAMQNGPITPQQVPVQSPMSMGMTMPSTPQPNTPHMSDVDLDLDGPYDGSNITQNAWSKALDKCTRNNNAVCEVAKVLFDEIFTDDEVIQCTFSGRGSTKKFNPNKVAFLKKATAWIMSKPARPWDFNMATHGDFSLSSEDETGTKGVEKKVFTEYRSRRRGDILKARQSGTTGPPSVSSVS